MSDSARPSLLTPALYHDLPLDPARAEDRAYFRFEEYTNTLARLIAAPETRTPLVVGINGKWGSGKTTLLRLLRSKLDRMETEPMRVGFIHPDEDTAIFRRCRTVWFNAWKYADEDSLLAALIRAVLSEMARGDWKDKLKGVALDKFFPRRNVLATLLSAFQFKLTENVGLELDLDKYKTETPFAKNADFFDDFNAAFDQLLAAWVHGVPDRHKIDETRGALVVFIDDLDRCLPAKTVQVLEAVKLFLDKPGAAFVIGADEDLIQSAVEVHYENQKVAGLGAKDYLDKIFQVRFPLPPLRSKQLSEYMTGGLGLAADLQNSIDLVLAGAETNPRRIKTTLNYLQVNWAVLKNSGQAADDLRDDFTRWLLIELASPAFAERARGIEDKDLRHKFVLDALTWAAGYGNADFAAENTLLVNTFQDYASNTRFRNVLKKVAFSTKVNADRLDEFVYWTAPAPPPASAPVSEPVREEADEQSRKRASLSTERVEPGLVQPGDWVKIPAGKFLMGSKADNALAFDNEKPQHTVDIPYEYLIGRTPVTNSQYREFVEARKLKWQPRAADDHPAVNVSWLDAVAYCEWLTQKLRQSGALPADRVVRLPTEAEWEKAARGEYGNEWPWGNDFDPAKCNTSEGGKGGTTPVGAYSSVGGDSPYGVADMAGNVWEWCSSLDKPYPYASDDGREDAKVEGARVLRGGARDCYRRLARCAFRYRGSPDYFGQSCGFRVCASPITHPRL